MTVPSQIPQSWALGRWRGGGEEGERTKFEWNLKKYIFKFDKSDDCWRPAQNYLLHSSLPLCSLLLTNCEGSHSVRLFPVRSWQSTVSLSYISYITKDIISYHQSSHYIMAKLLNSLKILQNSLGRCIFKLHQMLPFLSKMHQNRWRLGLRPRPRWGSLQRSPRPPSCWWGEGRSIGEGGGEGEGKGRGWEGKAGRTPLAKILDPPLISYRGISGLATEASTWKKWGQTMLSYFSY